ncbi:hypothetical protein Mgra_00003777, partial [Meloidogyne graminicola]
LIKQFEEEFNKIIEENNFNLNELEKFENLEYRLNILLKKLILIMDGWEINYYIKIEFNNEIKRVKSKLHKQRLYLIKTFN